MPDMLETSLELGQSAPDFTLPRDGGGTVALATLKGQAVILYFYPKDDTPGCTIEAQDFTSEVESFARSGAVILGISTPLVVLACGDGSENEGSGKIFGTRIFADQRSSGRKKHSESA